MVLPKEACIPHNGLSASLGAVLCFLDIQGASVCAGPCLALWAPRRGTEIHDSCCARKRLNLLIIPILNGTKDQSGGSMGEKSRRF